MPISIKVAAFAVLNTALNGLNYSFHLLTGVRLAPADYGQFNGWLAWAAVLMVAGVSLQMAEAARVGGASGGAGSRPVSRQIILVAGFILAVISAASGLVGLADASSAALRALLLVLLTVSHLGLSWFRGQIQGRRQWGALNWNSYGEVVVKLAAAWVLLGIWPTVEAGLASVLLGHLFSLGHAVIHQKRQGQDQEDDRLVDLKPFELKRWLSMMGTSLLLAAFFAVDMIAVSLRFPADSGAFAVAQKYGLLTAFLLSTLTTLVLPSVGQESRSPGLLLRLMGPLLAIAGTALAASVLSALTWFPSTVRLLFGPGYEGAVRLLPDACLAAGLLGLLQLLATLSTAGRGRSPWGVLGAALALILGFCLVLENPAQILHMESMIFGTTVLVLLVRWYREVRHGDDRS